MLTPFHLLVMAARHATFKNDPLKPAELDKLLRGQDKTGSWSSATLRGPREDFAQRYIAPGCSRAIARSSPPSSRTSARRDAPEDGAYLAQCTYGFPIAGPLGQPRGASLVVRGPART